LLDTQPDEPISGIRLRTYNLHEYEDEKAEALEAWAQRLKSIVSPVPAAPAKVVKLRGRRR
jgi:hypothetical protein